MEGQENQLWPMTFAVLAAAIPLATSAIAWLIQTLAQRAWNDYEKRRDAYASVIKLLDSLVTGDAKKTNEMLANIRVVWLYGSDEIIRAWNALSTSIKNNESGIREQRYSEFVLAIRQDLSRRRWFPPRQTKLAAMDFPLEISGSGKSS